ncbi:MAG: VOC family protein, partial [Armatimonadetes bacterium]|nr:VOC family protein [Armatimonadota bacterium]
MISSTAIFASSDIEATLAHYKDVLGFEASWTWGNPPSFGSASMGGVSIMFNLQPDLAARVGGHQHWIKVDDADELYRFHQAKRAKIVEGIEDKPWGVREYV